MSHFNTFLGKIATFRQKEENLLISCTGVEVINESDQENIS